MILFYLVTLFVWVDALRSRSTAEVMSGRSVIISTLFLGTPPEAGNQYLAHILSPLTDNCSSLISGKGRNGRRNNFMTKSSRKDVPDARIDRGAS